MKYFSSDDVSAENDPLTDPADNLNSQTSIPVEIKAGDLSIPLDFNPEAADQHSLKHKYKFNTTWNNKIAPDDAEITVEFSEISANSELGKKYGRAGLLLRVEAPFFDDPKLPEGTPEGFVNGLWNYEVVEIFFLGPNQTYLEIELGPRGHYLLFYLQGVLNVTNSTLRFDNYVAQISEDGKRWKGETFVPFDYLPPGVKWFNAYAIHKSGPSRVYMSLFPVATQAYAEPNFHRLEFFQFVDLKWN